MQAAQLEYTPTSDAAGLPLAISIFADRPHVRELIADDVSSAGFRVVREAPVSDLLNGEVVSLGEIVLLDCPEVDVATIVALARLDMRIARSGARLVVSTTMEALEDVFACLDQSNPRILVAPTRGERVVALGQELTDISRVRVREKSGADEISLLRLSEQVAELARKLDTLVPAANDGQGSAFRFASPSSDFSSGSGHDPSERLVRNEGVPLPDAKLVRQVLSNRQLRSRYFDGDLFADPAWDILLDLTAARAEGTQVSVTSLCIASGVPATTALRWINQMSDMGLLQRVEDTSDKRRAFIALTDAAAEAMGRYFQDLAKGGGVAL